jgi:hypothetical protein
MIAGIQIVRIRSAKTNSRSSRISIVDDPYHSNVHSGGEPHSLYVVLSHDVGERFLP